MKTILLHIDDDPAMETRLNAALSRRGIHAEVYERSAEPTVEDALMVAARELGAACIVMGGHGHSRMRELMFGGVTRAMLKACHVPLLLAH